MLRPLLRSGQFSWQPSDHAALTQTHLQYSVDRNLLLLHRQRDLRLAVVVDFGYFDPMTKCCRTWRLSVAVDAGAA